MQKTLWQSSLLPLSVLLFAGTSLGAKRDYASTSLCDQLHGVQDEGSSKCFFAPEGRKTWIEAERNCNAYGGHLASISSVRENHLVNALYLLSGKYETDTGVWIGFSDAFQQTQEGRFMWSDGAPAEFTSWMAGQPNDEENKQDCTMAVFGDVNGWDDQSCGQLSSFVCSIDTSCDDLDGEEVGNKCFYALPAVASHDFAEQVCSNNGGALPSIASKSENDALARVLAGFVGDGNRAAWIGFSEGDDQSWKWADGTAIQYLNWGPGQPRETEGPGRCAVLQPKGDMTWTDRPCDKQMRVVCEAVQTAVPEWVHASEAFIPCDVDGWEFLHHIQLAGGGSKDWRFSWDFQTEFASYLYEYENDEYDHNSYETATWDASTGPPDCFDEFWAQFTVNKDDFNIQGLQGFPKH